VISTKQPTIQPLDLVPPSAGTRNANVGDIERLATLLGGGALAFHGLSRRSPGGIVLALVGGALLYRGTSGHCAAFAKLFGEEPRQQIADDLRRIKQLMEAGEVATVEGQPAGQRSPLGKLLNRDEDATNDQPQDQWQTQPLRPRKKDLVMKTSEDSFPASDPPAWTGSSASDLQR
jgi:hypothetical protein